MGRGQNCASCDQVTCRLAVEKLAAVTTVVTPQESHYPHAWIDPRQPHTDFPGNEKGVRKCNFSVWLLTDSLRRFLLGCGIECLPSPARDGGPGISEFRCLLGKSCQEEVESDMCVPGGRDFRTRR